ncbi:F0F1 ATP synthase subunit epsilon [Methylomonas sp. LL1]|uniref:F0F1 ATP synthase subunit epsilon n=1 Tax=Methylomonas sp. LL1 TaxID=2785785 RepID=UPI0018C3530A|nr:F0F1 ATP synthase subunit epsilon [Methylomonas sp. LL1]QPK61733.1 F0F1 ATP synthase subunit epsilon [Methylomonas sp. LL1]
MKCFALTLLDSHGGAEFENITQFIGADDHGSFGILAGHIQSVMLLRYGLARFCDQSGIWHYLALPGGVLRFANNQLTLTTVRYFLGDDRDAICEQLAEEMARADSEVHTARATLSEIERSLVRRLAELSSHGAGGI